jgi:hypothetical protein
MIFRCILSVSLLGFIRFEICAKLMRSASVSSHPPQGIDRAGGASANIKKLWAEMDRPDAEGMQDNALFLLVQRRIYCLSHGFMI